MILVPLTKSLLLFSFVLLFYFLVFLFFCTYILAGKLDCQLSAGLEPSLRPVKQEKGETGGEKTRKNKDIQDGCNRTLERREVFIQFQKLKRRKRIFVSTFKFESRYYSQQRRLHKHRIKLVTESV